MHLLEKKMNKRNASTNAAALVGQQRTNLAMVTNPGGDQGNQTKRLNMMRKEMFKKRSLSSNFVTGIQKRNFSLNPPTTSRDRDAESLLVTKAKTSSHARNTKNSPG